MEIHICSITEYDNETRIPTIVNPNSSTFYLVPTEDGTSPDLFTEWVYVNGAWEMFGSAKIDLSGYLTDVQIDGTSIIENGVANIPVASNTTMGVAKAVGAYGIKANASRFEVQQATSAQVKAGIVGFNPIVPATQHETTFYGLAKASGDLTQSTSDNAVGTYTDEAKASIQDMLDVPSNDEMLSAYPVKSASGAVASFSDGADDISVKSLVIDIDPVQDLNGYDHPWVGGGGKNLINWEDKTLSVANYLFNGDISLPHGTYTLSFTTTATDSGALAVVDVNGDSQTATQTISGTKRIWLIESTVDIASMRLYGSAGTYTDFQLESGSSATSYEPYENICPISGWSEVNAHVRNSNLLNILHPDNTNKITSITDNGDGSFTAVASTTYAYLEYLVPVVANQTYVMRATSASNDSGNASQIGVSSVYDGDDTTYTKLLHNAVISASQKTFTPSGNVVLVRLAVTGGNGAGIGTITEPRLNIGSTALDYEAFDGADVVISLGQTVYGGSLNVTTGVLTVDRAMVDMGDLTWSVNGDRMTVATRLTPTPVIKSMWDATNPIAICSCYKYGNISNNNGVDKAFGFYSGYLYARDTDYSDANVFKTAMAGQKICYELATPTTVQLTPQEVKTLLGNNTIYADSGDTSVEYRADSKTYIDDGDKVSDVQINSTSIVENGVANVPIASNSNLGVVKVISDYGIALTNTNVLKISGANDIYNKAGINEARAITPKYQHSSTFYGLAKAAGHDEKNSTLAVGNYTDNAKDSIQNMLGITPLIASHESDPFESAHAIGELFINSGKLYRAKTALAIGEYIDENVNVEVISVAEVLDAKVDDVQMDGTSVVTDGVANLPLAVDRGTMGIVKINRSFGITETLGNLILVEISSSLIKEGVNGYVALTSKRQHESVFYGLAKVAGHDEKDSTLEVGTYTPEAKTAIKTMLGVSDETGSVVIEKTGTDLTITAEPNYRYVCGELLTLNFTPSSSGICEIIFTSGSTPTVLTLPDTVKMPDWWVDVEANYTYEICITDGVYGAVMSWAT